MSRARPPHQRHRDLYVKGDQGPGHDDGGRPCSVPCSPEHPEGRRILSAKMEMTQNEHGRRGAKAACPRQPQATLMDQQSCPPCEPGTVLTAARGLHRRQRGCLRNSAWRKCVAHGRASTALSTATRH